MRNKQQQTTLTAWDLTQFKAFLREQERAEQTIEKYLHDLRALMVFLNGESLTKAALISWKENLQENYAAASVNAMLAAVNSYLSYSGRGELRVKPLRMQRDLFCRVEKELTRDEYVRLVQAAGQRGNERLALLLQTICATGIRVSELQFITLEAARSGRAEVNCKGKRRTVFLPEKLRRMLLRFAKGRGIGSGAVFCTRCGKPLDRSNIWRDMKALCESAGVQPGKVFPHNLRHLFARTYYAVEKDLSRLADLLGHTSISTTRIYTVESGGTHARQIERMGLLVT
ncbi:tyrosine-type recombinase/integrase [Agathobaculum sp. NTUH-O15-33]|uniref:tyrosine-type recombinase/integrase n=1 Tax=Agathobaculum sp. NTUH-O15-33 TaxID=3079302 RepID=UPI002958C78F|nr:tyrosine-type recombinase/integrase [Agathobaculum sp. NTUH-O15-33]WNX84607.1 tyrosine-type recombinase/integrase [Agathobaculum sp. NTUH-O15-33]